MIKLKKLVIPKRYLRAEGVMFNQYCIVTTIVEPSTKRNRAKHGLITIKNQSTFNARTRGSEATQQKNEFTSNFWLEFKTLNQYHRGNMFLHSDIFKSEKGIVLSPDQVNEILTECTIVDGKIKDEFIYTNIGFMTAKMIEKYQKAYDEQVETKKAVSDALKADKVTKKDLIPGNWYWRYSSDGKYHNTILFLGWIKCSDKTRCYYLQSGNLEHQTFLTGTPREIQNKFDDLFCGTGRGSAGQTYTLFSRYFSVNPPVLHNPPEGNQFRSKNLFTGMNETQIKEIEKFTKSKDIARYQSFNIEEFL